MPVLRKAGKCSLLGLLVALLCITTGATALAYEVTIGDGAGAPGSNGNPISITAASLPADLAGFQVYIIYDKSVLTPSTTSLTLHPSFVDLTNESWNKNASIQSVDDTYNRLNIQLYDGSVAGTSASATPVTLCTVTFSVAAGASDLNNPLEVQPGSPGFADTLGNAVATEWVNGNFRITGIPTGVITLTADPDSITADGTSTSTITSSTIKDAAENSVPEGTKVTVATTAGTITTADADGTIAGTQVLTSGGVITFTLQSATTVGTATVTATSVAGDASGGTTVAFTAGAVSPGNSTVEVDTASTPVGIGGGDGITVTVTLRDADNNLIEGTDVFLSITGSGNYIEGSTVGNGPTSIGGTNASGVATGVIKSTKAEGKTISARGGATNITQTQAVTYTPGPADAGQSLIQSPLSPATITADDTATATVEFRDEYGNPKNDLGGAALIATGEILAGATWEVVDNGDGTATATYTPSAAGSETALQITLGGVQIGANQAVTVNPGAATAAQSEIVMDLTPDTITADDTATATVAFKDQYGNPTTSLGGLTLAATGATLTGATWEVVDNGDGTATATYTPSAAGSETALQITLGGAQIGANQAVTVNPGAAVKMTLTASRTTLASDTKGTATLTARILDQNDNLVTTDNTTQVTFTLTDETYATITGSPKTAVDGEATATVTTKEGTVPLPPATTDLSITSDPVLTPPDAVTLTIVNFSIQVNAPAAPFVDGTDVYLVTSASTPTTATFEGVGGTSGDYRWALTGVGSINSTTADQIIYTAPATITGDSQTATLTLTSDADGALTDTITITVYDPVTVTWPTTVAGIEVGDNTKVVTASGGTGAYEFESSNDAVATVAADGTITPVAAGTITVKVKDATYGDFGEENGFLAVTLNIQVVEPIVISGPTAVDTAGTETYAFTGGTGEVNWTADSGSITAAGVFTAPAVPSGNVSVKITATDKVFSDIKGEYDITVFGAAAIVEKPAGYVDGQPLTYPLVTAALTLSAQDATRSYDWVVTDWNDNPIVSQTTGDATFTLDPDALFFVGGAGVYTVSLTDKDNPDLALATLKVRIPMRFYSDDFSPADSGTYTVPPSVDDAYGADGGPVADVYVYGIYDLAGVEVADGVYGSFTDASPTGDANVFTFAAGIETLVSYRVKVSLDPASADADVVRLRDAGLDEVWSGIFRIVPVVDYSGTVVEVDGVTPVPDATVVAIHDLSSAVTTDGNGEFTTPGFELTGVNYEFYVRKDGYVDKIVTGADIEAGPIVLEKLDEAAGAGVIGGDVTLDDAAFSGIVEVKAKTADGDYVQDASGSDIVHIANPGDGSYTFPVPANFAARGPFDIEFRRSGYIFDAAVGLGTLTDVALNDTNANITLYPVTIISIVATPQDSTDPLGTDYDEVLVEIEAEAGAVPEEFDGTAGEIKVLDSDGNDVTVLLTFDAGTKSYSAVSDAYENFSFTVWADVSEDRDVDAGYKAVRTFTFIKSAVQNETAVDPILGGSATSPSGDNVVTVPPGGLTGDILGGLSVVIVEINAEEAGATRIIGSEILEVYLVDENGDRVPNGKIARIEIKLKFDPTVVLPGTLENGTFVIFQASSVTDLIAGRATPVPRGQIIPVVDYTNGFVTFWVDHLSAFGIGAAPAAPGPTPTPTPTPVGGGGGGGCFISTMTDGPVYPVWVATLFLVIFASAAWIVRRAAK